MANPAKKNGYFPIANELGERLAKISVSGSEMRILWIVLRKTWGWVDPEDPENYEKRKNFDQISFTQFSELTGMKHVNVVRSIQSLVVKRLLLKTDQGYGFNQDYDQWIVVKRLPPKGSSQNEKSSSEMTTANGSQLTTKSSSQLTIYKRNKRKKEIIQKKGGINSPTPASNAKMFFKGIEELINKEETSDSANTKLFLQKLQERYPEAPKRLLWDEVVKFWSYWTELNATGRKTRWEKQEAFQVERRLGTWFSKIKDFQSKEKPKGNYSPSKVH